MWGRENFKARKGCVGETFTSKIIVKSLGKDEKSYAVAQAKRNYMTGLMEKRSDNTLKIKPPESSNDPPEICGWSDVAQIKQPRYACINTDLGYVRGRFYHA